MFNEFSVVVAVAISALVLLGFLAHEDYKHRRELYNACMQDINKEYMCYNYTGRYRRD